MSPINEECYDSDFDQSLPLEDLDIARCDTDNPAQNAANPDPPSILNEKQKMILKELRSNVQNIIQNVKKSTKKEHNRPGSLYLLKKYHNDKNERVKLKNLKIQAKPWPQNSQNSIVKNNFY